MEWTRPRLGIACMAALGLSGCAPASRPEGTPPPAPAVSAMGAQRLAEANTAMGRGEVGRALQLADGVARAEPEAPEGPLLAARIRQAQGDELGAERAWRAALERAPASMEALQGLGQQQLDQGHALVAREYLERAYQGGARDTRTLCTLALALLTGAPSPADRSRAAALVKEAGDPQIPPRWFIDGLQALADGEIERAAGAFQRILTAEPANERALHMLAQVRRRQGRRAEAVAAERAHDAVLRRRQELRQVADLLAAQGPSPRLLRRYGDALMLAGRPAQAARAYQGWAQLAPADPQAREARRRAEAAAAFAGGRP